MIVSMAQPEENAGYHQLG